MPARDKRQAEDRLQHAAREYTDAVREAFDKTLEIAGKPDISRLELEAIEIVVQKNKRAWVELRAAAVAYAVELHARMYRS
jgi:uncharacterized protein YecT (DUF1311 family)